MGVQYPYGIDLPEEMVIFRDSVRRFVTDELVPLEAAADETGQVPAEAVHKMKALGFYGLSIPQEYGGGGLGAVGLCLFVEEMGKTHPAFVGQCLNNNGLGSRCIVNDGSPELRARYLPGLASGELIAAFALTEPEAGSDAASLKLRAQRAGGHYVLNGTKFHITGGPSADIFTVLASTDPQLGARGGISAFLVERGTPGFTFGRAYQPLGMEFIPHSDLLFQDCRVPQENLIGAEGAGFVQAMRVLDFGRLNVAALTLGQTQKLLDLSIQQAKSRTTFGRPLAANQAIQWMLVDMATSAFAARLMVYQAAQHLDGAQRASTEVSMAKLTCSEMAWRAADAAVQIHGAVGLHKGHPVRRFYESTRCPRIVEGTSEVQRMIIAEALLRD